MRIIFIWYGMSSKRAGLGYQLFSNRSGVIVRVRSSYVPSLYTYSVEIIKVICEASNYIKHAKAKLLGIAEFLTGKKVLELCYKEFNCSKP